METLPCDQNQQWGENSINNKYHIEYFESLIYGHFFFTADENFCTPHADYPSNCSLVL